MFLKELREYIWDEALLFDMITLKGHNEYLLKGKNEKHHN